MKKITLRGLLQFVSTLQDEILPTAGGQASFKASVTTRGLVIVPLSSNSPRPVGSGEIERILEEFNLTLKIKPTDYNFKTRNSSYLLALVKRFIEDAGEFSYPEEMISETFSEGAVRSITVNAYERDTKARNACISSHGTSCSVCEFSFGSKYGDLANGYIHVHHLEPLAKMKVRHKTDPVKDLRPVCPNCHAVLHLKTPPLSIEELRSIIRERNFSSNRGSS